MTDRDDTERPEGDLNADIHDALCAVFRQYERAMVTRWVVAVESVEEDGQRGLWLQAEAGMKPWDVLGLLRFATVQQETQQYRPPDEET